MNSTFPVAWIFLLFLVLVVFGALAAIIRRSWIIGGIVVMFALLIPGFYMVRAVPSSAPAMVMIQETATATPTIETQEPSPEQIQTADAFPTLDDATTNLARRLCAQVCDGALGTNKITHIQIVTTDVD